MRFRIVKQRIPEGLHTLPAITSTSIRDDRSPGQQGEVPVEFDVLMVVGVVTRADESVESPSGGRTAPEGIDATHQGGRGKWAQGLVRAEGRAS